MTEEDDYLLVHDAATISFDSVESDGITVDEDGATQFDWNEIPVVKLDEPPHARAFDTDEFYKIEGATTARPVRQPYQVGDDVEVYVKPADELRDAAWSMENRPYVLGHPDTGMVKDVHDVHGFWRNPRYDDDEDRLKEDLYIPKGDTEAMEFVSENQDVSLGFYNRVLSDYDGDIGGLVDTEEDHVDGYQVNLYVDHVAGVERGRCSSAHGCGLDDAHDHGTVVMRTDDTTSFLTREDQTKTKERDDDLSTDEYEIAPSLDADVEWEGDYRDSDDRYFAVAPDENADGEPKFPINNCSDVSDAWQLRGQGDIDISQDSLEERIRRRARDLDCTVPGEDSQSTDSTNMGDTDPTDDDTGGFDLPDLSIDALAEKHDDVRALRETKDELETKVEDLEEDLDAVAEGLGLEEDECPCDADLGAYTDAAETVEALRDTFEADDVDLVEFAEDMHEEWQEHRDEQIEEALDKLEDLKADREEWEDASLDEMEEEIERREEIASEFDASAVSDGHGGGGDEDEETFMGRRRIARGQR